MVSLMDWAEAKIVDLGCVCVMMMAKIGWTTQFFFVLCLRADAFELADGDGAPRWDTSRATWGNFIFRMQTPGELQTHVVLPFLCCPWKTAF